MKTKLSPLRKKRLIGAYILLSVIFAFIICYLCFIITKNKVSDTKEHVDREESEINFAIASRLLSTKALELDIIRHDGEIVDFEGIASFLCNEDPVIQSVQLAPNGVVTHVYPLEGNENAFIDLFADPVRHVDAQKARDTGKTILSGPFNLAQGGIGLIARHPIYLTDENGKQFFWGFSIVVLKVPDIFNVANINSLTLHNYNYRLWRHLPDSDDIQVIAENTDDPLNNAIQEIITVSNATWIIDIAPKDKWVSRPLLILMIATCTVIIILSMLALTSYAVVMEQRETLIRQNNTDGLTGIKNGRFFMNRIWKFAAEKSPCAVFYIDLNSFKEINDTYGHDAGDKILTEVARRIETCIRPNDIAARIGGDEFTVIIDADETEEYCEALQQLFKKHTAQPYMLGEIEYHPSISVGFARFPADAEEIEAVMRIADQRMYEDKRRSKANH